MSVIKKILYNISSFIPDKIYLKIRYFMFFKKHLNLKNPQTFNEKLQWLKLYNQKSEYIQMVDKYEVRKYIAEIIGEEYLIPCIGVWDKISDIDFDKLPNQFVLKSTHDSGSVIICKDKTKLNIAETKRKLQESLNSNQYWYGREWPYKNVKGRIICEEYMSDESKTGLTDYKFYCFSGDPKYCQVIKDRNVQETIDFYDNNWKLMDFTGLHIPAYPHSNINLKKPEHYESMLEIAGKLSKGFPFIRVDLYLIKNRIYFGELTFYPLAGFGAFNPPEWNDIMGNFIKLPTDNYNQNY